MLCANPMIGNLSKANTGHAHLSPRERHDQTADLTGGDLTQVVRACGVAVIMPRRCAGKSDRRKAAVDPGF
jgi:hypothetical protein